MELRNHPRMTSQGRSNWPPSWNGPHGPQNPLPQGEVGILTGVDMGRAGMIPHCFVIMHYNDQDYFGSLFFDDSAFLNQIAETLRRYIGLPIAEIGSLDIP